jgi:hypothetical protein
VTLGMSSMTTCKKLGVSWAVSAHCTHGGLPEAYRSSRQPISMTISVSTGPEVGGMPWKSAQMPRSEVDTVGLSAFRQARTAVRVLETQDI